MNWLAFGILAALATVLQLTVAPVFSVGRAAPDLAIVLLAAVALRTGANTASIAAFALGLSRDLTSGAGPGPFALMFVLAALLTGTLRGVVFPSRPLSMGFAALLAAGAVHGPYGVVMALRYHTPLWGALTHAFAIGVLTAVAATLAAAPLARIRRLCGWAPERELLA